MHDELSGLHDQSSSDSRVTAGAAGFLILTQQSLRPGRYGEPRRFDTMPSQPSACLMISAARWPSSVLMAFSRRLIDATPLTTWGMRADYATQPKPRKPELKRVRGLAAAVALKGNAATATT